MVGIEPAKRISCEQWDFNLHFAIGAIAACSCKRKIWFIAFSLHGKLGDSLGP